jgi:hypothetical protein
MEGSKGKVKVKQFLCLTKYHAMKTYVTGTEVNVYGHASVDLTSVQISLGPRAGLVPVAKGKR